MEKYLISSFIKLKTSKVNSKIAFAVNNISQKNNAIAFNIKFFIFESFLNKLRSFFLNVHAVEVVLSFPYALDLEILAFFNPFVKLQFVNKGFKLPKKILEL